MPLLETIPILLAAFSLFLGFFLILEAIPDGRSGASSAIPGVLFIVIGVFLLKAAGVI